MSTSDWSGPAPVSKRQSWLSRPELGAASISQAMAPTKGGVTSVAIISVRTVRRSGMSVRATNQPIGAATAQQIRATETEMISVVSRGSRKLSSVNSVTKLSSVKSPCLSIRLEATSQPMGSTISTVSSATVAKRTGREMSNRVIL